MKYSIFWSHAFWKSESGSTPECHGDYASGFWWFWKKVESYTYEEFIKSYEWMTRHLMNNSMVLASIERFLSMDPRSTARHSKQSFLGANGTGAVKRQVDRTLSWKEWLLNRPDTRLILLLCKRPRGRSKNFPNNQAKLQSHVCNKTC